MVSRVNSRKIADMRDLVDAIEGQQRRYHTIIDETGYKIVLDKSRVFVDGHEILKKYNIRSDRSKNLEPS